MFYILLVALWLFSLLLSFVILFCFHCFSVSTLCFFFCFTLFIVCLLCFYFSFFVSLVLINYSQNYFVIVLSVFFLFYVCVFVVTFFICCCFWYVLGSVFFFYFKFFCYFFPFLPFLSVCTLLALGSCIVGCRLCWRVEPGPPGCLTMHWSRGWSYTAHVTDHALITEWNASPAPGTGSVHAQSRYQCLLSHVITDGTVTWSAPLSHGITVW